MSNCGYLEFICLTIFKKDKTTVIYQLVIKGIGRLTIDEAYASFLTFTIANFIISFTTKINIIVFPIAPVGCVATWDLNK